VVEIDHLRRWDDIGRDGKAPICRFCKSELVRKDGKRRNKNGAKQRWRCLNCGVRFTEDDGFLGMRHTPNTITEALDMYYSGLSYEEVSSILWRHHGVYVSARSVLTWARKYGRKVWEATKRIKVDMKGRNLHADEAVLIVGPSKAYLWMQGFGSPHFIMEIGLTRRRLSKYPRKMFRTTKRRLVNPPPAIVTDGYWGYPKAISKWFYRLSEHHVAEGFGKWPNQQRIERLNGDAKGWCKERRWLKRMWSSRDILYGWAVHHNFVEHDRRKHKTPAEAIGINIKLGRNKWLDLIRWSTKNSR